MTQGQEGSNEDETELFGGEQQCATRAAARVPSEHASSLAAAGRQDRDREALQ